MDHKTQDAYTIDLMHIMKVLWKRVWIIALAGVLAAAIGFSYAAFMVTPLYSSSVMLYVNNSSINLGNTSFNITTSDLSASQSLIKTYSVILKNRTTLERVIEKTGVSYSVGSLSGMITAASAQETEIMKVTVTSADPYEAAEIANCIAEVLPARIAEIIDGASMEVVDSAVPNPSKISPNISRYTAIGLVLGLLVSAGILAVVAIMDNTIHDEEYILQTYNFPILAKVPNLMDAGSAGYGYYKKSGPAAEQ